jgi:hypothetical protein
MWQKVIDSTESSLGYPIRYFGIALDTIVLLPEM